MAVSALGKSAILCFSVGDVSRTTSRPRRDDHRSALLRRRDCVCRTRCAPSRLAAPLHRDELSGSSSCACDVVSLSRPHAHGRSDRTLLQSQSLMKLKGVSRQNSRQPTAKREVPEAGSVTSSSTSSRSKDYYWGLEVYGGWGGG